MSGEQRAKCREGRIGFRIGSTSAHGHQASMTTQATATTDGITQDGRLAEFSRSRDPRADSARAVAGLTQRLRLELPGRRLAGAEERGP